jgi:hypothetical protein
MFCVRFAFCVSACFGSTYYVVLYDLELRCARKVVSGHGAASARYAIRGGHCLFQPHGKADG